MKKKKKKVTKKELREAINRLTEEFNAVPPDSAEAVRIAGNIKTLSEALDKCPRIKGDTVVACGATVMTTAMLLAFERNNCITSKVLSFIPKIKIH